MAINKELIACGGKKVDALVIAHESVISPRDKLGNLVVDGLGEWHAHIAFNEDCMAEGYCVADRVTAALAILSSHAKLNDEVGKETLRRAQLVLSTALIEHPVLLHTKLVIPYKGNGFEQSIKYTTLVKAICLTDYAQMPSCRQGINPEIMRLFATSALPMAINRLAPDMAFAPNSMLGFNRFPVTLPRWQFDNTDYLSSPGPLLMASIMENRRIRNADSGVSEDFADDEVNWPRSSWMTIVRGLTRACGFHDFIHSGTVNSTSVTGVTRGRECLEFMNEVALSGCIESGFSSDRKGTTDTEDTTDANIGAYERANGWANGWAATFSTAKISARGKDVLSNLTRCLYREVFQCGRPEALGIGVNLTSDPLEGLPQWAVKENTTLAIAMLKTIGLGKNVAESAEWLYSTLVGAPECGRTFAASMAGSLGFLEAIESAGIKIPAFVSSDSNPDSGNWGAAHAVVRNHRIMQDVLDHHRNCSGQTLAVGTVQSDRSVQGVRGVCADPALQTNEMPMQQRRRRGLGI